MYNFQQVYNKKGKACDNIRNLRRFLQNFAKIHVLPKEYVKTGANARGSLKYIAIFARNKLFSRKQKWRFARCG